MYLLKENNILTEASVVCITDGWTEGINGTCSMTCGNGDLNRTRTCIGPSENCTGSSWEIISCNSGICAIEGRCYNFSRELKNYYVEQTYM